MQVLAVLLSSCLAITTPLTGCQRHAMYPCISDLNCESVIPPPFCPSPAACPQANCVLPPSGFSCSDCFVVGGALECGTGSGAPLNALCQSKTNPLYKPPHIWEPMAGTWDKTVELLNDEREKRGQCPLEWDEGLAMDCVAGGVVGQACATLTSSGDASDLVWHPSSFTWEGDADAAATSFAATFRQANSVGQWVMADEAEKVGCCICREYISGQASIVTSMCLARKAGGAVPPAMSSPVGSPKQACVGSGGGMGPCTPTVVSLNGMALVGTLLAAADLTKEHAEPLGTGQLVDFSNVAVAGAPDGEVVLLSGDKVGSGDVLSFECPLGCDEECEVYVVAYHCPACPGSLRGGMAEAAKAAGWEVSSCAPVLQVGGEAYPTVSLRKVLAPGTAAVFPSGEVKGVAVLTFRRELGVGCPSLGEVACGAQPECTFKGGACLTDAWCSKRFGRGPFAAPTGPGCSAKCLA